MALKATKKTKSESDLMEARRKPGSVGAEYLGTEGSIDIYYRLSHSEIGGEIILIGNGGKRVYFYVDKSGGETRVAGERYGHTFPNGLTIGDVDAAFRAGVLICQLRGKRLYERFSNRGAFESHVKDMVRQEVSGILLRDKGKHPLLAHVNSSPVLKSERYAGKYGAGYYGLCTYDFHTTNPFGVVAPWIRWNTIRRSIQSRSAEEAFAAYDKNPIGWSTSANDVISALIGLARKAGSVWVRRFASTKVPKVSINKIAAQKILPDEYGTQFLIEAWRLRCLIAHLTKMGFVLPDHLQFKSPNRYYYRPSFGQGLVSTEANQIYSGWITYNKLTGKYYVLDQEPGWANHGQAIWEETTVVAN